MELRKRNNRFDLGINLDQILDPDCVFLCQQSQTEQSILVNEVAPNWFLLGHEIGLDTVVSLMFVTFVLNRSRSVSGPRVLVLTQQLKVLLCFHCVLFWNIPPHINQWVRFSPGPGGETFHQWEIRALY